MCEPTTPFIYLHITKPGFYAYRQTASFCGLDNICSDIWTTYQTTALSFWCHIMCRTRSEEHTSELQSRFDLVCRLLLEKKNARAVARQPSDCLNSAVPNTRR